MASMYDDIRVVVQQSLLYSRHQVHFNALLQEEIVRSRLFLGAGPAPRVEQARGAGQHAKSPVSRSERHASAAAAAAAATIGGCPDRIKRRERMKHQAADPPPHNPSVFSVSVSSCARRTKSPGCCMGESSTRHAICADGEVCRLCGICVGSREGTIRKSPKSRQRHHPCSSPPNPYYSSTTLAEDVETKPKASKPTHRQDEPRSRSSRIAEQSDDRTQQQRDFTDPNVAAVDAKSAVIRVWQRRRESGRGAPEATDAARHQPSTLEGTASLDRIDAHIQDIKETLVNIAAAGAKESFRATTAGGGSYGALPTAPRSTQTSPTMVQSVMIGVDEDSAERGRLSSSGAAFDSEFRFPVDEQQDTAKGLRRPMPLDGRDANRIEDDEVPLEKWHPPRDEDEDRSVEHSSDVQRVSSMEPTSPSHSGNAQSARSSLRDPGQPPPPQSFVAASGFSDQQHAPSTEFPMRSLVGLLSSPMDLNRTSSTGLGDTTSTPTNLSNRPSALTPTSEKIYASKRRVSKVVKPISVPTKIGAVLGRDRAFDQSDAQQDSPAESPPPQELTPPSTPPLTQHSSPPSNAARAPTVPPEDQMLPPSQFVNFFLRVPTQQMTQQHSPPVFDGTAVSNASFPAEPGADTALPSPAATPRPPASAAMGAPGSPILRPKTPQAATSLRVVETGPPALLSQVAKERYKGALQQHRQTHSAAASITEPPVMTASITEPPVMTASITEPPTVASDECANAELPRIVDPVITSDEGIQVAPGVATDATSPLAPVIPLPSAPPPTPTPPPVLHAATTGAPHIDVNSLVSSLLQGLILAQQQQQERRDASVGDASAAWRHEGSQASAGWTATGSTRSPVPAVPPTPGGYVQALAAAQHALSAYKADFADPTHRRDTPPLPTPRRAAVPPVKAKKPHHTHSGAVQSVTADSKAVAAPHQKRPPLARSYVSQHFEKARPKVVVYLGSIDRPTCSSLAHSALRYRAEHALAPEDAHCADCFTVNLRRDSLDPEESAPLSALH